VEPPDGIEPSTFSLRASRPNANFSDFTLTDVGDCRQVSVVGGCWMPKCCHLLKNCRIASKNGNETPQAGTYPLDYRVPTTSTRRPCAPLNFERPPAVVVMFCAGTPAAIRWFLTLRARAADNEMSLLVIRVPCTKPVTT
jgi:hypothetical protein